MSHAGGSQDRRTLRHRVASGVAWNASATGFGLILQTLSTVFLARLIAPGEFGLYAIAAVFYYYGNLAGNLGLGAALIQRPNLTKAHLATAFWLNAALGVALTVALALLAPAIAAWVGAPHLEYLLRLVAISYTINLAVVPMAMLERDLRFRAVASVEIISAALGLAAALIGGYRHLGAVALADQLLVQTLTASVLALAAARYLPTTRPTKAALRELWSVSAWLTAGNLVGYWSLNADTLALGATQPLPQVGYYNRAYNLLRIPLGTIGGTMSRVIIPALASIQHDVPRSREAWLSSARVMALVTIPASIGMAVTAPALIETLWGDKWLPVIPILRLLALAGIPWAIAVAAEWLLFARGRARVFFWLALANTLITIAAVLCGLPWGPIGVAIAMLVRSFLIVPLYVRWCLFEIGVGYPDVGRVVGRILGYSVVMGGLVLGVGRAMSTFPSVVVLAAQVAVGTATMLVLLGLFSPALLAELRGLVRRSPQPATESLAAGPTPRRHRSRPAEKSK
jgi:O-antigen/teichoic acid export membrane protein